jgi:hypothetical protein
MEIARMASTSLPTMPQANDVEATRTATDVRLTAATEIPEARSRRRKFLAASVLGALAVLVAIAFGIDESGTQVVVDEAVEVEASTPPPRLEATLEAEPVAGEEVLEPTVAKTDDASTDKQPVEAKPPAQKRSRSQQRAKAQPGTINLVTRGGWAEIYEGKKLLGSTPRRLTLSSGRHKLVLKPFGTEKPKTVYVVVEANKTKKVSIALD